MKIANVKYQKYSMTISATVMLMENEEDIQEAIARYGFEDTEEDVARLIANLPVGLVLDKDMVYRDTLWHNTYHVIEVLRASDMDLGPVKIEVYPDGPDGVKRRIHWGASA